MTDSRLQSGAAGGVRISLNVAMAAQSLYSLADGAGMGIRCEEGSVWVTLDDDPRDVVLNPGDAFETDQHRRVLITAFTPARLEVSSDARSMR